MPSPNPCPRWVPWALAGYALAAGILLLSPFGPDVLLGRVTGLIREDLGVAGFRQGWIEAPANVLLFVPLGLLLTLFFRRPWVGVIVAILLSIGAELVQITLPDRLPSLRDVVANALGAAIGAGVAWMLIMVRRRSRRRRSHRRPG